MAAKTASGPAASADNSNGRSDEQIAYEIPMVRCNKQNGILLVTSQRIAWSEELSAEFKVSHRYGEIKTQKISSEQSSKVQLQLVFHNGGDVKFQFLGETSLKNRDKVKDYLRKALEQHKPTTEIDEKARLLNEDPNLYQMYKDLVVGGAISAEEFWANRMQATTNAQATNQQLAGLPSAFLADVRAEADGCNSVRYNLTADAISSIFRCYPAVKAKHAQLVPDKMPESDFWVMFFQSQHFHRDRSKSKKDLFAECLRKDSEALGKAVTVEATRLDELVDESNAEGYGIQQLAATAPPQSAKDISSTLGQRCNTHSAMVLQALGTESAASSSRLQYLTEADDNWSGELLADNPPAVATLQIEAQDTQGTETVPSAPLMDLAASMQQWEYCPSLNLDEPISVTSSMVGQSREIDPELVRHYGAVTELLRHFWACFPTRTPELEQKLTRMVDSLEHYQAVQMASYEKAQPVAASSSTPLEHLNSCISLALQRYRLWSARRGPKR